MNDTDRPYLPRSRNVLDLKRSSSPAHVDTPSDALVQELQRAVQEASDLDISDVVPETPAPTPVQYHIEEMSYLEPVHPIDTWVQTSRKRILQQGLTSTQSYERRHPLLSVAPWLVMALVVVSGLLYVSNRGIAMKDRMMDYGKAAIASVLSARSHASALDFEATKLDITQTMSALHEMQGGLGSVGRSLLSVVARIPGADQASQAHQLLELSDSLSLVLAEVQRLFDVLPSVSSVLRLDGQSDGTFLSATTQALASLESALTQARTQAGKVSIKGLTPEIALQVEMLQGYLARSQELVGKAKRITEALALFTGSQGPRRYLVLFQNSSELRPTGGFPGSYGIATFENGRMTSFRADDIYNPDGQVRDRVVPPLQLQHITQWWGMRDAGWFVDFPQSARKTMEFWRKGGGSAVDGVIAIKPEVLERILKVTGAISLTGRGLTLQSDTVVTQLQQEVEESRPTGAPKQVIVELAPLVIGRLADASPQDARSIATELLAAAHEGEILLYASDTHVQKVAFDLGIDGSVHQGEEDYLQVNVSNVKGAKTDAVTDTRVKLEAWRDDGTMVHRLTLIRRHDGGTSPYGFYNEPNHAWIRILVPEGSVLRGITGNTKSAYAPLVDYAKESGVLRDADLSVLESTYKYDASRGVTSFEEANKTGFGFWLSTQPGGASSVQLEYVVPARNAGSDYRLVVERQPGLQISEFEFDLRKDAKNILVAHEPKLTEWSDSWRYVSGLQRDLLITLKLESK